MWWQGWLTGKQVRARVARVTCPCCRGHKRLNVIRHDDENSRTFIELVTCLQCDGTGELEDISGG
jgi:hypothetical protein